MLLTPFSLFPFFAFMGMIYYLTSMIDYQTRIEQIRKQLPDLRYEQFSEALSGTHHKVFLSEHFVIRFRDDNNNLLRREAELLKQLDHHLIPTTVLETEYDHLPAIVENRLPGSTMNSVWKDLSCNTQNDITKELVDFIKYLRNQPKDFVYSVVTGKEYNTFLELLTDSLEEKLGEIQKIKKAGQILKDIQELLEDKRIQTLFSNTENITLNHGDLIIHNILTDGNHITGILDWELALFGDLDYDLCRLFYYKECAQAYQNEGVDDTFESDYMNRVAEEIQKQNLIENKELFQEKYTFIRAIFFLNALHWAARSKDPQKNTAELIARWK